MLYLRDIIILMDTEWTKQQQRDTREAKKLFCGHSLLKLSHIPDIRLVDIIKEVNAYASPSSIHTVVNTAVPGEGRQQNGLEESEIQDLFYAQDDNEEDSSINEAEYHSATAVRAMQIPTIVATTCPLVMSDASFKNSSGNCRSHPDELC
eukprot:IDg21633t1